MNINLAIKEGSKILKNKFILNSQLDAEILMAKTINKDRNYILLNFNNPINKNDLKYFHRLIEQRSLGKPVAYLVNNKHFWDSDFFVTETISDGQKTGWKLFRIPLEAGFNSIVGDATWQDIRTIRLWTEYNKATHLELIDGEEVEKNNKIKIAKIEISSNQWEKLGIVGNDTLSTSSFQDLCTSGFNVEVINTDENAEYVKPLGVTQEVDEYTGLTLREQSLVIAFDDFGGIPDSNIV